MPVAKVDDLVKEAVAVLVLGQGQLSPGQVGLDALQVAVDHCLVELLNFTLEKK